MRILPSVVAIISMLSGQIHPGAVMKLKARPHMGSVLLNGLPPSPTLSRHGCPFRGKNRTQRLRLYSAFQCI